jgi:hypothetical protein
MIAAIDEATRIGGVEPDLDQPDVKRESEYAKKPASAK